MSTKRLTKSEMATFLIGEAISRTLETATRDPEMLREIEIVGRWIDTALTPEERDFVMVQTGWLPADLAEEMLNPDIPPREPWPDDEPIPF